MHSRHGLQLSSLPPPSHSQLSILLRPQSRHHPEQTQTPEVAPTEVDERFGCTSQLDMIMHMDIDWELSSGLGGRRVQRNPAGGNQFSPLQTLPNETLHTVFEYLPPSSLVSLLQVCRRLHGIVERILYTNISIIESVDTNTARPSPDAIITPHTTLSFCSTVRARPYLLPCVRRLAIRWTRDRARKNEIMNLSPSVVPSLHSMLLSVPNIDSLELHLAGWRGGYAELLRGCSFRLKSLALSGPLNAPVEWFLSTQPGIVYLHLGDHHAPLRDLSPSDLPRLETFRGDALAAASILPGRPVLGLALSGYEPSETSLISFAYTKYPIRCLDLSGLSVTPTQLLTISKHLTALETLRMRLALRHTLHFTFSGMMLLSALTQVLGAFQNLAHLDLSPTSVVGVASVRNEDEEHQLCRAWAGVCPSLRRVRFPSGTEWVMGSSTPAALNPSELGAGWRPRIRERPGSPRSSSRRR